ncbi:hypothetical protein [Micromonospora peucetia]|uniref:Inositol-3-phosphate synthase n=1 Tax=Micromonospora peucetia TaxID=47871 RepID=A0ABZ1E6W8_9ACTN|nr:hypothetical protein [Micromonospora peucetia]WSA30532.1 inositol-3-phosphate synthase [Micromonospora peucetia]
MRTGVWLVGARGSVATTSVVGALAPWVALAGFDEVLPPSSRYAYAAARAGT